MEAITISASPVTWMAKILAYRRLEIIQSLLQLYPHLTPSQLTRFYEAPVPQPIGFAPLSVE